MNRKLFITLVIVFAAVFMSVRVSAETNTNGTVMVPQNVNENVNASSTTPTNRADFRDPAALKPLLLVPLAGVLYLVYEKLAKRNK